MINEKCAFRLYEIISSKSLISIYAGITTILICINTVYIIFHSINCENFYKIPATYFTNISIVEFFREIIPFIFLILFIIFSGWISRTKTETIIDESLVAISAGVIVTVINLSVVYNCLGILYISPLGRTILEQYPMVITILLIIVFAGIPMFLSSTYKKNENQANKHFAAILKKVQNKTGCSA